MITHGLREIGRLLLAWIDTVARTVQSLSERFERRRHVELVENDDDTFTLRMRADAKATAPNELHLRIADGAIVGALPAAWVDALRASQIRIVLRSTRFLCRPLDLPKRAAEFLDGIVRSQIDRLTPWTAGNVAYGWTPPLVAQDRIQLKLVATARAMIAPYVVLAQKLGAASVAVAALVPEPGAAPGYVEVFEQRTQAAVEIRRIGRVLTIALAVTGLIAIVSLTASEIVAGISDSEQQQIADKIARRRAAMRASLGPSGSAEATLQRQKRDTASSVIVLEALSRLLPDHTYVTELRIEGDKVQVVGITQDAPSLISLIEQSQNFTRATFFAPTTRSANDPGDRFHIEARLKPNFELGL